MSENPSLLISRARLNHREGTVKKLGSLSVLVEDREGYQYFHESFFDYAFARNFCSKNQSLFEFLVDDPQHLFRRGQVRQILSYCRDRDPELYYSDLESLLNSTKIRFHQRRMVAIELKRIEHPDRREFNIISQHVLDGELARPVFLALHNHPGWFDQMYESGLLREWLASNDDRKIDLAMSLTGREIPDRCPTQSPEHCHVITAT